MRRKLVAGNWKMNGSLESIRGLLQGIKEGAAPVAAVELAVFPPFVYLGLVLYVGLFAFRKGTDSREDFFVASRSLGPWVFLLTVFGTNMTAFAILGVLYPRCPSLLNPSAAAIRADSPPPARQGGAAPSRR